MTAFSVAIERQQYELAALRLLLSAMHAIDRLQAEAPRVREELIALLTAGDA